MQGATESLGTSECSGPCPARSYCPTGSTSGTPCPSRTEYCPEGASAPVLIFPGYYADSCIGVLPLPRKSVFPASHPGSAPFIGLACAAQAICLRGHYCSRGEATPCPAGTYVSVETWPLGLFGHSCMPHALLPRTPSWGATRTRHVWIAQRGITVRQAPPTHLRCVLRASTCPPIRSRLVPFLSVALLPCTAPWRPQTPSPPRLACTQPVAPTPRELVSQRARWAPGARWASGLPGASRWPPA